MSEGVPVSATYNALDRIETAISLAFEGEGEAWSDRLSGDRLAHSARRAIEDIWDGLVAAERAKAWDESMATADVWYQERLAGIAPTGRYPANPHREVQ